VTDVKKYYLQLHVSYIENLVLFSIQSGRIVLDFAPTIT